MIHGNKGNKDKLYTIYQLEVEKYGCTDCKQDASLFIFCYWFKLLFYRFVFILNDIFIASLLDLQKRFLIKYVMIAWYRMQALFRIHGDVYLKAL